jgi:protein-S-isoprenylcysteine O-methyltransferase Ste14
MKAPSRTLTTLAFGLMALNAVLLAFGAIAFDRPRLFVPAAVCAAVAGGVVLAWRWYRRNLAELDAARPELRRQVEEMRDLLRAQKP